MFLPLFCQVKWETNEKTFNKTHTLKKRKKKKRLENRNLIPKGWVIWNGVTKNIKRKPLLLEKLHFPCFGGRESEIERKPLAMSTFQLLVFPFFEDL